MKTNRRNFIIAATTVTASTTLPTMATTKNTYPIVHHVFFWLKNSSSTADRDQLVKGVKTLSKIETIRELQVGIVAATEKRDVVDQSWAVSELMFFDSLEAQKTYQDHPIHLEFIKNYSHLWEKVVVYDIQNV